jgi:predicted phosphodiesterase
MDINGNISNRTIILGDTHGRRMWEHIVKNESFDRVIFVGDYWDSFDIPYIDQMYNFKQIVHYARTSDKEVILLTGNHDVHYQRWALQAGESYSGFQSVHANEINQELQLNEDIMQMAYKMDNFLFTHAGVTKTWLELMEIENDKNMVDVINDIAKFKPRMFGFGVVSKGGYVDGYGDNVWQNPTWVRPKSLMKDSKGLGYIQVVGHTGQNQIDIKGKSTGGKYYFIDTLETSGEYLIIEDGKVSAGKFDVAWVM